MLRPCKSRIFFCALFLGLTFTAQSANSNPKSFHKGARWTIDIDGQRHQITFGRIVKKEAGYLVFSVHSKQAKGHITSEKKGPLQVVTVDLGVGGKSSKCFGSVARNESFVAGTCSNSSPFMMTQSAASKSAASCNGSRKVSGDQVHQKTRQIGTNARGLYLPSKPDACPTEDKSNIDNSWDTMFNTLSAELLQAQSTTIGLMATDEAINKFNNALPEKCRESEMCLAFQQQVLILDLAEKVMSSP